MLKKNIFFVSRALEEGLHFEGFIFFAVTYIFPIGKRRKPHTHCEIFQIEDS